MIISSIKVRTNLIAKSLEISKSSRLFSTGLKKNCRGKFRKITSPSYLKRIQIPHTTPLRWWLAWWGTIDRLFLAKCGNIIAHSSGFYVKWSERCENHYYFANGKEDLNTFIKAQSNIWKVMLEKDGQFSSVSLDRALTLTNLYPSCQVDFFVRLVS